MIISEKYLLEQSIKRNIYEYEEQRKLIFTENTNIMNTSNKYDIFLSHSSLDKKLLLTLMSMFNDAGYSVYVDWIEDKQLDRNNVNRNTAQILRHRMNNSQGLAYIATSNSAHSRWCPWELGYFDGKNKGRCCILPIMESESFRGQEYLSLYPYLDYNIIDGTQKYEFWVNDPENKDEYITLSDWLDGKNP